MAFFGGGGASVAPEVSIYGRSVYGIGTSTPSITISDYSSGTASNVTVGNGSALILPECQNSAQTRNHGAGSIRFTPFYLHKNTKIYKFITAVGSSPAANRLLQCGFYSSSSNGLPENFIANSNYEFSIGTTIGNSRMIIREYPSAINLSKGVIWFYSWTDGDVAVFETNSVPIPSHINLYGYSGAGFNSNLAHFQYTKTYSSTPVSSLTQAFGAGSTQDTFFYSTTVPRSTLAAIEVDP